MKKKIHQLFPSILQFFRQEWLLLSILIISTVSHSWNMLHFPYFENDEAVYLSQAWSILKEGELAPYTYWYDHSPVGWIFVAIWVLISQGLFTFGFSLNSGRVLMLIVHLVSTFFLYRIGQRLTDRRSIGFLAGLFFSLSPLAIYFQRRLLLDNIMMMWVLFSYWLLLGKKFSLRQTLLSAIMSGIAILTKENAIFFVPGFLITIILLSKSHHRTFAFWLWLIVMSMVVSLYLLMALLKGELFPSGTFLGGDQNHVSLLGSLAYQVGRPGGIHKSFWESDFWILTKLWTLQDSLIMLGGMASSVVVLLFSFFKKFRKYMGFIFLYIGMWIFLIRGGVVLELYIVPIIPLSALMIGIAFHLLTNKFSHQYLRVSLEFLVITSVLVWYGIFGRESRAFPQHTSEQFIYQTDHTTAQIDAVGWVKSHFSNDEVIVTDNYSFLDFRESSPQFENSQWYWKVDLDPEIQRDILQNNFHNISLILMTPQMQVDIEQGVSPMTSFALGQSINVKTFDNNGWNIHVFAKQEPEDMLRRSWFSYKNDFINEYGQVIDKQGKQTTSEGQSYAMLRAVWSEDRRTFDSVWRWTQKNLVHPDYSLFVWRWETKNSDLGTASDADLDIAMSLILAYQKWGDIRYLQDAQKIVSALWEQEVKTVNDIPYLIPGNWAKENPNILLNPSYFSPVALRMFAEIDSRHDWLAVLDSGYQTLTLCSESLLDKEQSALLPPNWCQISETGLVTQIDNPGLSSTDFSYDAIRTIWRLSLDYQWYQESRAEKILLPIYLFMIGQYQTKNRIVSEYTHDGVALTEHESALGYVGVLPLFSDFNDPLGDTIFREKIVTRYHEDYDSEPVQSFFDVSDNYYTQNWAWFNIALYSGKLKKIKIDRALD